jgi:hypothetical protein
MVVFEILGPYSQLSIFLITCEWVFQPSQMFAVRHSRVGPKPPNIRLGYKGLSGTNNLTFWVNLQVVKSYTRPVFTSLYFLNNFQIDLIS